MQVYHYWSRLKGEATLPSGKKAAFFAWGGSRVSQEDAGADAAARIKRIAERILSGHGFPDKYAYGERPLREEVLQEYFDEAGDLIGAITRNSYGAAILNTAHVAFLDVDLPHQSGIVSFVAAAARWLRRELPPDPQEEVASALQRLDTWLQDHPSWGIRIYRTRSGLRYLITHSALAPDDAELASAMEFLGVDLQYRRLCHVQKSFRARLTPKPWRVGLRTPPSSFPRETDKKEQMMQNWLEKYNAKSQSVSTCKYLRSGGRSEVDSRVLPFLELHDRVTKSDQDLPLA